ncbi:MAG: SulP family inorganic anion transporter [Phycisphaerae bacterium]|nr:SulP family inorganic anion transporter [Phycisphaerae bacterium]
MATSPAPSSFAPSLPRDAIAGVAVFLVAIPLCLGIALASGAPALSGIIAGIVGGIVVGALSGSHVSVTGPAAGLAAIVLTQIQRLGSFDAFLLAVLMSGVFQLCFGIFRAGALARFFPSSVIKGLLAAIGTLLILKQIPHLVGHDQEFLGKLFFLQPDIENMFSAMKDALHAFIAGAALVGLVSLVVMILWNQTPLKRSLIPGALAAVVIGTVLSELLRLGDGSMAIDASHLVSLPVLGGGAQPWSSLITPPDFSRIDDGAVWIAAATLAIVASIETLLNLEATDQLDPQRRTSSPNRELVAQGVGNSLSGLLGGLPVTSVIVRSSVNASAGATTRRSAIIHGGLLVASLLLFPRLMNLIPLSSLAAVLIYTGWKLASPALFRSMWIEGRSQFIPFIVTVVAIVVTDLLLGVALGLVTSWCMSWGRLVNRVKS